MFESSNNQTFDFATAIHHLQAGRSVRSVFWKKDVYARLTSVGTIRRFSLRSGTPVWIPFPLLISDFTSEWELYNG